MTLSPGQKVQPNRSMRISPGGFSAFCSSMLSERAPRPPRFIGQSTWMSRIGSSPKRFGSRSSTENPAASGLSFDSLDPIRREACLANPHSSRREPLSYFQSIWLRTSSTSSDQPVDNPASIGDARVIPRRSCELLLDGGSVCETLPQTLDHCVHMRPVALLRLKIAEVVAVRHVVRRPGCIGRGCRVAGDDEVILL